MSVKKIGLTTYGFSIRNGENNRIDLNCINDSSKTFLELLYAYINGITSVYENDNENDSIFLFEKVQMDKEYNDKGQEQYKIMYIRVKTGDYGIESELVDSNTGKVSYKRKENDADVMPFGVTVVVPSGSMDNGIIILQSISRYGIKVALQKRLDNFVKIIDNDYNLMMGAIVPRVMLNRFFKEGILQKIRMIRFDMPNDVAERYGLNAGVNDIVEERVIKKPVGFLNNRKKELEDWRTGKITYDKLIQVDEFIYDDLKLEFKLGKTLKTISLKNVDELQVCEDVTDDVQIVGGHPTFESLTYIMKETAVFYLVAKGLIISDV